MGVLAHSFVNQNDYQNCRIARGESKIELALKTNESSNDILFLKERHRSQLVSEMHQL